MNASAPIVRRAPCARAGAAIWIADASRRASSARFHGIFNDELGVYASSILNRGKVETPIFQNVDQVYGPGQRVQVRFVDQDRGSPMPVWRAMGSPQYPTPEQIALLRQRADIPPPRLTERMV